MACNCKNEDGTLSINCKGTCLQKELIEGNAILQVTAKELFDKFDFKLSSFLEHIKGRLNEIESIVTEKYKEGYRDGFRDREYY